MPSDPTGVHPKGILARPAPDFFDDNLATGGAMYLTNPPAGLTYASISLFNNANSGIAFKVYGLSAGNDDVGTMFAYMLQGAPLGSLIGPCANVRPDLGTPYGQIYKRLDVVAGISDLYPLPTPPTTTILSGMDAGSLTLLSPFPLFIVPVGWSLVIANTVTATQVWAGFWYQQANE